MIDTSTIFHADRCPRCIGRRVIDVDREHGFWRCAPSSMPFAPPEHLREHDAMTNSDDDERTESAVENYRESHG